MFDNMWKKIIKSNPRMIVNYSGDGYTREKMISYAIECGYTVTEEDLIKSKILSSSPSIEEIAIDINPLYIKYFLFDYSKGIITREIDNKISEIVSQNPNINVYNFESSFKDLLKEYPNLILVAKHPSNELIKISMDSGYTPNMRDIRNNKELCSSADLFEKLIEQDFNNIRYYSGTSEDIFKLAMERGFAPKKSDLHRLNFASSDAIVMKLLEQDYNLIELYKGDSQEVFDYAISRGYKLTPKRFKSFNVMSRIRTSRSDNLMKQLIDKDFNYIYDYTGNNESVFEFAFSKMNESNIDNLISILKDNRDLSIKKSSYIFKKMIDGDESKGLLSQIELMNYYNGQDLELCRYAFNKGFVPNEEFLNKNANNLDMFLILSERHPELCEYFTSWSLINAEKLLDAVLKNGYIPSEEIFNRLLAYPVTLSDVVEKYVEEMPQLIKYYRGEKNDLYIKAIKRGYIPSDEVIKNKEEINKNFDIMVELVLLDPKYVEYYNTQYIEDKKALKFLVTKDPNDIPNYISNNMKSNSKFMSTLIEVDIRYLSELSLTQENVKLAEKAMFEKNYFLDINPYIYCFDMFSLEAQKLIVAKYPNIIEKIFTTKIELYKIAQSLEYKPQSKEIQDIFKFISNPLDFSIVKNSLNNTALFTIAINNFNYKPSISDLNEKNYNCVSSEVYNDLVANANLDELIHMLLCFPKSEYLEDDLLQIVNKIWNKIQSLTKFEIPFNLYDSILDTLKKYGEEKVKTIITFFPDNSQVIKDLSFSTEELIKYAPDYLDLIFVIYKKNMNEEFAKVKEYFVKNEYLEVDDYRPSTIKNIIKFLDNYLKNPDIYKMVVEKDLLNGENKKEIISSLEFISLVSEVNLNIHSVEELIKIKESYVKKYKNQIQNIQPGDVSSLQDIVCHLLFGKSFYEVTNMLLMYGNPTDLRLLLFNNKNNKEIHNDILEMLVLVNIMQDVVSNNNFEDLMQITNNALLHYDKTFETLMLFSQFDEKMRKLYEKELIVNTTKIKNTSSEKLDGILDKEMTKNCGVDVIDLSDSQYCLIEHCVSDRENVEDLVNGIDKSGMLTICLSIGSHRGQALYSVDRFILATDSLPDGSFIRSSTSNMSSNGSVVDVMADKNKDKQRIQRGALELSIIRDVNSEVLAYRNGVKFKYILLPGGRKPTDAEIEMAKKYGLKFVKIQSINSKITNPKKIDSKYLEDTNSMAEVQRESSKKFINVSASNTQNKSPRRMAVFTDAHALFEPTLAILEDARRQGITEIYSLGDNIGTGPNPKEVLDLLSEYGVKSIQGNHELYALGFDKLSSEMQKHLEMTKATEEARRNGTWTKGKLTEEQLSEISQYPTERVIEVGGKKIYLTHYSKKYDGESKSIPKEVDKVLQGHIHFASDSQVDGVDLSTLRGVGIGMGNSFDIPRASYIIITETEDGYKIDVKEVLYNSSNLYHTINESDMPVEDKDKIEGWSGVRR